MCTCENTVLTTWCTGFQDPQCWMVGVAGDRGSEDVRVRLGEPCLSEDALGQGQYDALEEREHRERG